MTETPRSSVASRSLGLQAALARCLETARRLFGRLVDDAELPPLRFVDADGRDVRLRAYDEGATDPLVAMYDSFDPEQGPQGTPPRGESAIREWLDIVLDRVSVLAWHRNRVVGHVMFVPDGAGSHELAIFVHPRYQRAGIGTELLRAGLGHARARGVTDVWLIVEPGETGLRHLYRQAGFALESRGPSLRMARSLSA